MTNEILFIVLGTAAAIAAMYFSGAIEQIAKGLENIGGLLRDAIRVARGKQPK